MTESKTCNMQGHSTNHYQWCPKSLLCNGFDTTKDVIMFETKPAISDTYRAVSLIVF